MWLAPACPLRLKSPLSISGTDTYYNLIWAKITPFFLLNTLVWAMSKWPTWTKRPRIMFWSWPSRGFSCDCETSNQKNLVGFCILFTWESKHCRHNLVLLCRNPWRNIKFAICEASNDLRSAKWDWIYEAILSLNGQELFSDEGLKMKVLWDNSSINLVGESITIS